MQLKQTTPTPADYVEHFRIPELRNQHYLDCFKAGRKARFETTTPDSIPIYSHDKTRQSLFVKGWCSVSSYDLMRHEQRKARG